MDWQAMVLQEMHGGMTGGHLGEDRTFKKLQEWFYRPGRILSKLKWSGTCTARKRPTQKHRRSLQNVRCGYPMQMVAADIVGPLPRNSHGNRYILVLSNYFTRWAEAYAIPNQEAKTIDNKLVDWTVACIQTKGQSTLVREVSKLLEQDTHHCLLPTGWWFGGEAEQDYSGNVSYNYRWAGGGLGESLS